jgi:hypothetical protein
MKNYDFIMLLSPEYNLFSDKQDRWMYDRIVEGAGGFNDGSVFSIQGQIAYSWANSMTQTAFPNDAPAVLGRPGGYDYINGFYSVVIERGFTPLVFTPYIPFDVQKVMGYVSRYTILREGADVMAWNVGGFSHMVPRFMTWDYEKGRTVTDGGYLSLGVGFFGKDNPYGGDMIINMVLYIMQRKLIEDVEVFHRIKGMFSAFSNRIGYLISLTDFIDKFGANTESIQDEIQGLRAMKAGATDKYLESDFQGTEEGMLEIFDVLPGVESLAKRVKDSALWWVYLIEWLATTSVLFISGFLVWSLMVRRRLYRSVATTRMRERGQLE